MGLCAHTAQLERAVLSKTGCALAMLFACNMAGAQQHRTASDETLQLVMTTSWAGQNTFVEVFGGRRKQDYRQIDTQGIAGNGILDTETGNQTNVGIALRWQSADGWLLRFQAQRQSGVTNYAGYLQAGDGSVSTHLARSGNVAAQASVSLGFGLHAGNWQVAPLLQIGRDKWQRNLVQYGETYDFNSVAVGALAQWRVRPGTVLELQALKGKTYAASTKAPELGFAAEQPGGALKEWYISISQDLGVVTGAADMTGWRGTARYSASKYDHGASPVVNGVQAPPDQHQPSAWSLGLQKQF